MQEFGRYERLAAADFAPNVRFEWTSDGESRSRVLGDRLRTSTSLFTFLLLTIVAGTTWALWLDASVRPPTGSLEPVTTEAAEGELLAENNPAHRPVIEVCGMVRDAASPDDAGLTTGQRRYFFNSARAWPIGTPRLLPAKLR